MVILVTWTVAALFAFPKDSFGWVPLRPEDIAGGLLLLGVLWHMQWARPTSELAQIVTAYLTWFGLLALVSMSTYPLAGIFFFKECAALALGWAVAHTKVAWSNLIPLVLIPSLLYATYQLVTREPRGLYGIAPFGHEHSPQSAGFWCLACVFFGAFFSHRWLIIAGVMGVLFAGSKIAVLGCGVFLLVWMGWSWRMLVPIAIGGMVLALSRLEQADTVWGGLGRYAGFLHPIAVFSGRGIWDKFDWLQTPEMWIAGAGYVPPHLRTDGSLSMGMAMDNQGLYYLITGGFIGVVIAVLLAIAIYRARPATTHQGRFLRALVLSYAAMGLGAEVLQLSLSGNTFWLLVGLCV